MITDCLICWNSIELPFYLFIYLFLKWFGSAVRSKSSHSKLCPTLQDFHLVAPGPRSVLCHLINYSFSLGGTWISYLLISSCLVHFWIKMPFQNCQWIVKHHQVQTRIWLCHVQFEGRIRNYYICLYSLIILFYFIFSIDDPWIRALTCISPFYILREHENKVVSQKFYIHRILQVDGIIYEILGFCLTCEP